MATKKKSRTGARRKGSKSRKASRRRPKLNYLSVQRDGGDYVCALPGPDGDEKRWADFASANRTAQRLRKLGIPADAGVWGSQIQHMDDTHLWFAPTGRSYRVRWIVRYPWHYADRPETSSRARGGVR